MLTDVIQLKWKEVSIPMVDKETFIDLVESRMQLGVKEQSMNKEPLQMQLKVKIQSVATGEVIDW